MIESLLEEITGAGLKDDFKQKESVEPSVPEKSEQSVLAALPVVRAIVNRKIISSLRADASDLIQGITLRLLKWRKKYREKSDEMSPDEWESFAARTAYNEINRYFSNQNPARQVPIEEAIPIAAQSSAEGNTKVEFSSLANLFWQKICCLSLRQRRALLLSSGELIKYLRKSGIEMEEVINVLEIPANDWEEVENKLPLTDFKIAELLKKTGKKGSLESLTKSIKKGRHEARKKMRRLMD